jgi:hypothetical protein
VFADKSEEKAARTAMPLVFGEEMFTITKAPKKTTVALKRGTLGGDQRKKVRWWAAVLVVC